VLAWTLFAIGGVYNWSLVPSLVAIVMIAMLRRPAIGGDWRGLDAALGLSILAAALQLSPIPASLRAALSPAAADFDRRISIAPPSGPFTLSLVPSVWLWGIGTLVGAILVFWIARQVAQGRDARFIARMVAWMGLATALLAILEPALFPNGKIYGVWEPYATNAHPAGPIVNRNHYAAWLLFALPLTLGCFAAHVRTHWLDRKRRVQIFADSRAIWLLAASALMAVALFVTQSRSGILGFGAAVAFGLARGWRRGSAAGRFAMLLFVVVLGAAVFAWARPDNAMTRFDRALQDDTWGGRAAIWRESIALGRQFPLTGTGLGTFNMVMPAYQTATHSVLINQAHNQYLHLFVEGGLLVAVPLAAAFIAFVLSAARRLREDRTAMVHLREAALAGMCGIAVQSIWEAPLLTPAVLFLMAASAGLAVHRPPRARGLEEAADD
jgi:O-antigen ligase